MKKKHILIISSILGFCVTFIGFNYSNINTKSNSPRSHEDLSINKSNRPHEYNLIINIIKRLATYNDLGKESIYFTITSGNYANWLATELDICDQDDCTYFGTLNPFKTYTGRIKKETNEIIRQSYLLGKTDAYALPNNTIAISRSTFKTIDKRHDVLAFIFSHEIAHVIDNSQFYDSLKESKLGRFMDKKERKKLSYTISRESEFSADKKACLFLFNAGYSLSSCTDSIILAHLSSGDGEETKEDSTHPGYEERLKAMEEYVKQLENKSRNNKKSTIGKIIFNKHQNFIKYSPTTIESLDP